MPNSNRKSISQLRRKIKEIIGNPKYDKLVHVYDIKESTNDFEKVILEAVINGIFIALSLYYWVN